MNKKLIHFVLFLFLSISLSVTQAYAQQKSAASKNIYTLGEVVVRAEDNAGVESTGTIHEITDKDIEARNVKTLDKALELLPGVDVRKGAKGIPRVNMRGLRSRHVVLLLNGIPFNSTYDGQFNPATIPVENIAKIKVSYGTHSVLYGQGGIGGAINIITKKGNQGIHGNASGDMDERGAYNGQVDFSGANDKVDFFVSASKENSAGYKLSEDFIATSQEDGGLRENSDCERENLFAGFGFQANDNFTFGISAGRNTGEYSQPASTISDTTDPFYKNPKYDRVNDYDGQFYQVSMGYDSGGIFGLRSWAYINKNEEDKARYDDGNYDSITKNGGYTTEDETMIKGVTLQSTLDYGTYGNLAFSMNAEKNEYDSVGSSINKKKGPLVPYNNSDEIKLYTLAFEYDVKLFEKLGLVAGYSHHWQKKDTGSDDDKGSYLFGLFYDLTENAQLRASYAKKIRFASIKNLYDTSDGNSELSTEQSDNYEAGISWKLPGDITADVAFFLNDVENYIAKDAVTEKYENNSEYRFKGFETTVSKALAETGMISLGYSYMSAEDKSAGSLVDDLEYRPKHKITAEGKYSFDFGLTAYASFMRLMGQCHYSSNETQKGNIKDFSIVDIKLEQNLFKEMYFIYAGVDNLFDKDYEESYGYPQPGRTAYAGMKIKF